MRRWILAGVLLLLVVAIAGRYLVLPAQVEAQLIAAAEDVGLDVEIGSIDFSFVTLSAALIDVRVSARGEAEPFAGAERLDLDLEWRPLLDQTIHLKRVHLTRPMWLTALDDDGLVLPTLALEPPETVDVADAGADNAGWHLRIDRSTVESFTVSVAREEGQEPITATIHARALGFKRTAEGGFEGPIELGIEVEIADGELAFDGVVSPETPPSIDGALTARNLAIPTLAGSLFDPIAEWWRSGRLEADLRVRTGDDGSPIVSGSIRADDLDFRSPQEDGLAVRAPSVSIELTSLELAETPRVRIAEISLDEPSVDYWSPDAGLAALTGEAGPEQDEAGIDLRVDAVRVVEGRVVVHVRTPPSDEEAAPPPFDLLVDDLAIEANGLDRASNTIEEFKVRARVNDEAPLRVNGQLGPEGVITGSLDEISLVAFQPLIGRTGLEISAGTAQLDTDARLREKGGRLENHIVFQDLSLESSDPSFVDLIGVPVSTAVALLTGLDGTIRLDVPVEFSASSSSIALGGILRDAVGGALKGALTAPLKIIGGAAGILTGSGQATSAGGGLVATADGAPTPNGGRVLKEWADLALSRPHLEIHVAGRAYADESNPAEFAAGRRQAVAERLRGLMGEAQDRVVDAPDETMVVVPAEPSIERFGAVLKLKPKD